MDINELKRRAANISHMQISGCFDDKMLRSTVTGIMIGYFHLFFSLKQIDIAEAFDEASSLFSIGHDKYALKILKDLYES
jgi:hypothetical protein